MFKKTMGIIISTAFIFLLLTGCSTKTQIQTKGGLRIASWSSGLGGVSDTDLNETKFSYTINLTNGNETTTFVKSIQPSIGEKAKNRILSKDTVVAVNKDIKPNETIQIRGEIVFNNNW